MIHAINRADGSFNPDTAYICSRHFVEDNFIPRGKEKYMYE